MNKRYTITLILFAMVNFVLMRMKVVQVYIRGLVPAEKENFEVWHLAWFINHIFGFQ